MAGRHPCCRQGHHQVRALCLRWSLWLKKASRFHAVYWPAMLMALDMPLAKTVLAHAHWTMDQMKMSKSRGNVVNPFEAIQRFSRDGIRNFLMFRGGLENDADFAESHVERDYRKYLAGQLGNLLQRLESKTLLRKAEQAIALRQDVPDDAPSEMLLETITTLPGNHSVYSRVHLSG